MVDQEDGPLRRLRGLKSLTNADASIHPGKIMFSRLRLNGGARRSPGVASSADVKCGNLLVGFARMLAWRPGLHGVRFHTWAKHRGNEL